MAEAFAAALRLRVVVAPRAAAALSGRSVGGGDRGPVETGSRAASRIVNPRLCTVCNRDLFYSYRLEGPVTGRQGCVAWAASGVNLRPSRAGCATNLAAVEAADRWSSLRCGPGRDDSPRLLVATKYLDVGRDGGAASRQESGSWGRTGQKDWRRSGSRWSDAFEFHFIGHLQSRKVRQVLPYVSLIHSVESISLVEELDQEGGGGGTRCCWRST